MELYPCRASVTPASNQADWWPQSWGWVGGGWRSCYPSPHLQTPGSRGPRLAAGDCPQTGLPHPRRRDQACHTQQATMPKNMADRVIREKSNIKEHPTKDSSACSRQREVRQGRHGAPGHTEAVGGGGGSNRTQRGPPWTQPVNGGSQALRLASEDPTARDSHQGFSGVHGSSTPSPHWAPGATMPGGQPVPWGKASCGSSLPQTT